MASSSGRSKTCSRPTWGKSSRRTGWAPHQHRHARRGGYLSHTPQRSAVKGLDKLRTARVLAEGMLDRRARLLLYDALLDDALADPARRGFLAADRLEGFRALAGCASRTCRRDCGRRHPRTVVEVEKVCAAANGRLRRCSAVAEEAMDGPG